MMIKKSVYCVCCGKNVDALLVDGLSVYPHRPDLSRLMFYQCPNCNNYVGTHKGTLIPLGCIPTHEIMQARHELHCVLDPLWQSGMIARRDLYDKISAKLGYEFHAGNTKSIEEIETVKGIIASIKDELK